MLCQQRQRLIHMPLRRQHRPRKDLHRAVLRMLLRQRPGQPDRRLRLARRLLCQGLHRREVRRALCLVVRDRVQNLPCLPQRKSSP